MGNLNHISDSEVNLILIDNSKKSKETREETEEILEEDIGEEAIEDMELEAIYVAKEIEKIIADNKKAN